MLKRIGAEESGEFKAVASGTLPSGRPVVVNSDGTVSVVAESSDSAGSGTVYETGNAQLNRAAFDSSNNKVVIVYQDQDNSSYGTAVVGTVSGNSISFGTPVVFASADTPYPGITFDSSNNKIVVVAGEASGGEGYNAGRARVGTVSGTSISFGTAVVFNAANTTWTDAVYDSGNGKIVVVYKDQGNSNYGTAVVGTVSGTSISFGSEVVWQSANMSYPRLSYDTNAGKVVLVYRDNANSSYGTALVGTVSGTSISFGSEVIFNNSGSTLWIDITYDSTAQKHVIVYQDGGDTYGKARIGTVSGTSISFGTEVTFESAESSYMSATYDSNANKTVVLYRDQGNSNKGTAIIGTVSGTNISFGTPFIFHNESAANIDSAFDSNSNKIVVCFQDGTSSVDDGTGVVVNVGSSNLTSENYIGMSRGVAFQTNISETLGSATVFNSANSENIGSTAFDSTNNKVVVFYKDGASPDNLEAVVGTVSDGSLSFGSSTEFHAGGGEYISAGFDSSNGKFLVVYKKTSNNYLYSKVGTVSGTSISFGSEVAVDTTGSAGGSTVTFDSTNNKIVVSYTVGSNFYAKVGTISGTSISYGSRATIRTANVSDLSSTFDTDSSRVIVVYKDQDNSNYGTAQVGTVSGTGISFNSQTVFVSSATSHTSISYIGSNKVFIGYRNNTDSGRGIIGTLNTATDPFITFGSVAIFDSNDVRYVSSVYHSDADKVIVFYQDNANSDYGEYVVGTVSGTSVSFTTGAAFESAAVSYVSAVYDSNDKRAVVFYRDEGGLNYGTAISYVPSYTQTTRGGVSSGNQASIDIIGSVSDNQLSLTAGQQYFVQTDGTISTTADDPSVLAGTAISATELLVKT